MVCVHARVSVHMLMGMCVTHLHTLWNTEVCVHEYVCTHMNTCAHARACVQCVCVCVTLGSSEWSLGASNNGFGKPLLPVWIPGWRREAAVGRADFVAWLHVRVSTWVCFN